MKNGMGGRFTAQRNYRFAFLLAAFTVLRASYPPNAVCTGETRQAQQWIGTWAAAPQPAIPGTAETFRKQTLRLIVHTSAGGATVRIKLSNTFGDQPLIVGAAHIARRASGADIEPASDRALAFSRQPSATVPARSMVVSDPVDLDVPALSDLAISLFLPEATAVTTAHILALQTNYVSSAESGDLTAAANFTVAKTIEYWPFLTGVDVAACLVPQRSWHSAPHLRMAMDPQRTPTGAGPTSLPNCYKKRAAKRRN